MSSTNLGSFAGVAAMAAILVALFSTLLMKAVGKVSKWTFLADDSPDFMVTAGARAVSIALIVLTFIFINKSNYTWFGYAAAISAFAFFALIGWFDRYRKTHTCKVPLLNADGTVKRGWLGSEKFRSVVVGSENDMKREAQLAYGKFGEGSVCKFLSGYGRNEINNAEAVWSKATLAKISSKMTVQIMGILLFGVMTLYLAASTAEMHQRP